MDEGIVVKLFNLLDGRDAGALDAVAPVEGEAEDAVEVVAAAAAVDRAAAAAAIGAASSLEQAAEEKVLDQLGQAEAALGDEFGGTAGRWFSARIWFIGSGIVFLRTDGVSFLQQCLSHRTLCFFIVL